MLKREGEWERGCGKQTSIPYIVTKIPDPNLLGRNAIQTLIITVGNALELRCLESQNTCEGAKRPPTSLMLPCNDIATISVTSSLIFSKKNWDSLRISNQNWSQSLMRKRFFTKHDQFHSLFGVTWSKVTKESRSEFNPANMERLWYRFAKPILRAPWSQSYGSVVTTQ